MSVTKFKAKHTSWRDVISAHPAAELFPSMSSEELRKLGEDIKANGLRNPIVLWAAGDQVKHGDYMLLDGCNRLDAMELVGLKTCEGGKLSTLTLAEHSHVTGNRAEVVLHLHECSIDIEGRRQSAVDPFQYAISANLQRRHLTKEQQATLIIEAENMRTRVSSQHEKKLGRPADHVKAAATETGRQFGISKGTMQRAWDKANRHAPAKQFNKIILSALSPKRARVRHIKNEMKRLAITTQDLRGMR